METKEYKFENWEIQGEESVTGTCIVEVSDEEEGPEQYRAVVELFIKGTYKVRVIAYTADGATSIEVSKLRGDLTVAMDKADEILNFLIEERFYNKLDVAIYKI